MIKPNIQQLDKYTVVDDILYRILEELQISNQSQNILFPHHFQRTYVLQAGESRCIDQDLKGINEKGILKLIQIQTDNENIILELTIDSSKIVATPKDLADWGLFGEHNNMFFILKYDTTVSPADIRLCYNTDTKYVSGIKAKITNPTTSQVNFFISVYRLIRT